MAKVYKALSTVTVGSGGSATVEFTSIPQTYTDLVIFSSARTDRTLGLDAIKIVFNGIATNYTRIVLTGDGTSPSSFTSTNAAASLATDDLSTANTFGNSFCYIPNYTSSNYKSFSVDGSAENNGTSGHVALYANLWSNTANITNFELSPIGGTNFKEYSTFYLYGISNGS
jgi:hypothetical protein